MIIKELSVLQDKKINPMSIDYGLKKIGISILDPYILIPMPYLILENDEKLYDNLALVIKKINPNLIAIGLPVQHDPNWRNISDDILLFSEKIYSLFNIDLCFVDESYSNIEYNKNVENLIFSDKYNQNKKNELKNDKFVERKYRKSARRMMNIKNRSLNSNSNVLKFLKNSNMNDDANAATIILERLLCEINL